MNTPQDNVLASVVASADVHTSTNQTPYHRKFNILNFADRLIPSDTKGKYFCPVCKGNDFTFNEETGAYKCHNNQCDNQAIKDAINPLSKEAKAAYKKRKDLDFRPVNAKEIVKQRELEAAIVSSKVEQKANELAEESGVSSDAKLINEMAAWAKLSGHDIYAAKELLKERIKARKKEDAEINRRLKLQEESGDVGHKVEDFQREVTDSAATPDHHLNVHFFREGKGNYCVLDGSFHKHENNCWKVVPDDDMHKVIGDQLKQMYRVKPGLKGEPDRIISDFATERNTRSVFGFNRANLAVSQTAREGNENLINFTNGVLNVKDNEFRAYSKSDYLNSQIQAPYVAGADCPHDFAKFAMETFGIEQLPLIRAIVRYYTDPSMPYEKFVHLIGKSGAGKGTFIDVIGGIHGDHYGATNDFGIFLTAESRHANLTGKRLIGIPDMQGSVRNMGAFYSVTVNEPLSGRPLYSPTAYTRQWAVRVILGSAEPLQFEKSDAGWDRRCIPLPVRDRDITTNDHTLPARLKKCRAQIISWAMGMGKDEATKMLWNASHQNPESKEAALTQAIAADSIRGFIDACLVKSSEGATTPLNKSKVYGWYKAYCEARGLSAKAFVRFSAGMKTILGLRHEAPRTSRQVDGQKVNVPAMFREMALVDDRLFVLKRLPGGDVSDPQQELFTCNAAFLSDGNLDQFSTQATQGENLSMSQPKPSDSMDYSSDSSNSYRVSIGGESVEGQKEDQKSETDNSLYRAKCGESGESPGGSLVDKGLQHTHVENPTLSSLSREPESTEFIAKEEEEIQAAIDLINVVLDDPANLDVAAQISATLRATTGHLRDRVWAAFTKEQRKKYAAIIQTARRTSDSSIVTI